MRRFSPRSFNRDRFLYVALWVITGAGILGLCGALREHTIETDKIRKSMKEEMKIKTTEPEKT